MSDDRTYDDEEVREILDLALSTDDVERPALRDDGGLTLAQIQEAALEVGVEPARVARAAQAVDARHDDIPRRTSLRMPVSVGRIIDLPGPLTDRQWGEFVAAFREVAGSGGYVTSYGELREWTDGATHAFVEPTPTGYRLRLESSRIEATTLNRIGVAGLTTGLIPLALVLTGTSPPFIEMAMLLLLGGGGGTLATNLMRLSRWGRKQESRMDAIAERVRALLAEYPPDD